MEERKERVWKKLILFSHILVNFGYVNHEVNIIFFKGLKASFNLFNLMYYLLLIKTIVIKAS